MSAKILFLDIETAPETAYIWKRFKETVGQSQIKEPGYLLCISYTWNNTPTVYNESIYLNRSWKRGNHRDDYNVVKKAWELLDEADIVVGHNIRSFDIGTLNARFIKYGMKPPSPYKICDTLELAKKKLRLPSNSLESISHFLNIDTKQKQSFELWKDCLDGVFAAWNDMITYCNNDVHVVRKLYLMLIPWFDTHPNMQQYNDSDDLVCTKCGSKHINKRGIQRTLVCKYQRYQCRDCGGWFRGRKAISTCSSTHAVVS